MQSRRRSVTQISSDYSRMAQPTEQRSVAAHSDRPVSTVDASAESALARHPGSRAGLAMAATLVAVTSTIYFSWWLEHGRATNPWLLAGLAGVFFYVIAQIYGACYVYLRMKIPARAVPRPGMSVDVFVPVYDEPYEMVEECLTKAVAMTYPHRTFLIDDRRDPELANLAQRVGAEYRTRADNRDAKAGNVNTALATTQGEFVVVFDVDHTPDPDFLDAVLGYFDDPTIGFVQAAVGFRNDDETWTALATAEQCEDAYGPTSMGMSGCGAAPVWGSHCTFRRKALRSIGGHGAGLAEDLQTSICLHAAGWRSLFVPDLKARGLVPSDFEAVAKQQYKWARGVFEVLFKTFPRLFHKLTISQNVAYLLRCTYYLIGPLFLVHALLACALLSFGSELGRWAFAKYLACSIPLAGAVLIARRAAIEAWEGAPGKLLRWRGYVQAVSLWPIYTFALTTAMLRIPVEHIATPKVRSGRSQYRLVVPQITLLAFLALAVTWRIASGLSPADVLPICFAAAAAYIQVVAIRNAA